jgi:hypothetical protein
MRRLAVITGASRGIGHSGGGWKVADSVRLAAGRRHAEQSLFPCGVHIMTRRTLSIDSKDPSDIDAMA